MQTQPYPRNENLPVPLAEQRGPLAERTSYHDWNGRNGYATNVQPDPHVLRPTSGETYFEVLFQQIKKRWILLSIWLLITAGVAGFVLTKFAKPMWKAEGALYYSPKFSYSHKPLYTPPNIQTILALAKSPEILDKVSKEMGLTGDLSGKLTVAIVKSSDFISVTFESPDKATAEKVANRVVELVIAQYDQMRHRLSEEAIVDLDITLEATRLKEHALRNKLNDTLGKQNIFDLKTEISSLIHEISSLRTQISQLELTQDELETQQLKLEQSMKKDMNDKGVGPLSEADVNRLSQLRDLKSKQSQKQTEVEIARIELRKLEEEKRKNAPIKQYISAQEQAELETKILKQKQIIADGLKQVEADEALIVKLEMSPTSSLPLQQTKYDLLKVEVQLIAMPKKIQALKNELAKRQRHQDFLQRADKEAQAIQQEIDEQQKRREQLTVLKQDHEKIEANKLSELTIHTAASAGGAPVSSNHLKLGAATFGLSLLLFIGFVAMFDMPRAMPQPAMAELMPNPPGSHLPVPAWQNAQPMPAGAGRTPPPPRNQGLSNEHLRALAERIAFNPSTDRGKIVLFTPTSKGLCVENLLGDLGCYLTRNSGRVLVFEARTDAENPAYPAWTGPSSREASEYLDNYLEGRSERTSGCFAETLISSIDYARSDLSRHLQGVMAMYRFRRLMNEMKERYSVVLMITPERFQGEEDDVFTTLGEGIVVVINQDANPNDVEEYLRGLSSSETPVYGAFTVPLGQNHATAAQG